MRTKSLLFSLLLALFSFTNCSKEKGCTDADADNYNPSAEESDGSCTYSGNLIFWQSSTTALINEALGVTEIRFYVNGQYVGSQPVSLSGNNPDCGEPDFVEVLITLGSEKYGTALYVIKDQNGNELTNGSALIEADICVAREF